MSPVSSQYSGNRLRPGFFSKARRLNLRPRTRSAPSSCRLNSSPDFPSNLSFQPSWLVSLSLLPVVVLPMRPTKRVEAAPLEAAPRTQAPRAGQRQVALPSQGQVR